MIKFLSGCIFMTIVFCLWFSKYDSQQENYLDSLYRCRGDKARILGEVSKIRRYLGGITR